MGLTSRSGVIPCSEFQDTVGPLTTSVKDAACVLDVIAGKHACSRQPVTQVINITLVLGKDPLDKYTEGAPKCSVSSYTLSCKINSLAGIRVGVPRKVIQDSLNDPHILRDFNTSLDVMRKLGAEIVENVNFPAYVSGWKQKNRLCSNVSFRHVTNQYLGSLKHNPDNIRSVEDVMAYICTHENESFPQYNIEKFKRVLTSPQTPDSAEYKAALGTRLFMGAEGGVLGALEEHHCDVLALPTDSENPTDLSGYPAICVPLGFGPQDMDVEYSHPNLVDRGPNVP